MRGIFPRGFPHNSDYAADRKDHTVTGRSIQACPPVVSADPRRRREEEEEEKKEEKKRKKLQVSLRQRRERNHAARDNVLNWQPIYKSAIWTL